MLTLTDEKWLPIACLSDLTVKKYSSCMAFYQKLILQNSSLFLLVNNVWFMTIPRFFTYTQKTSLFTILKIQGNLPSCLHKALTIFTALLFQQT